MGILSLVIRAMTMDTLEATCTGWETYPHPGWFIRGEAAGQTFYAQITQVLPQGGDSLTLHLTLVAGQPATPVDHAELLTPQAYAEAMLAHHPATQPITWQGLTLDLARAGRVVAVIQPPEGLLNTLLQGFAQTQAPMLIIDPTGELDVTGFPVTRLAYGPDISLSMQDVGMAHVLSLLTGDLPASIQAEATTALLAAMPATPDFITVQHLADNAALAAHPLASLLRHQLFQFHRYQVFAAQPQHCLHPATVQGAVLVHLGAFPAEMRPVAYRALLFLLQHQPVPAKLHVVLHQPQWVADAAQAYLATSTGRVVAVSQQAQPWAALADDVLQPQTIAGEQGLHVTGRMMQWHGPTVLGLPQPAAYAQAPVAPLDFGPVETGDLSSVPVEAQAQQAAAPFTFGGDSDVPLNIGLHLTPLAEFSVDAPFALDTPDFYDAEF